MAKHLNDSLSEVRDRNSHFPHFLFNTEFMDLTVLTITMDLDTYHQSTLSDTTHTCYLLKECHDLPRLVCFVDLFRFLLVRLHQE